MKKFLLFVLLCTFTSLTGFAQSASTGQITGVVKDPNQAVVAGTQVILTNPQTKVKITAVTNDQGAYAFAALQPGAYVVEVDAKGFKPSVSPELNVTAGQTVNSDFALALAGATETVNVSAGSVENAYRVDNVKPGGPLRNGADSGPSLHGQRDFAPIDRRHPVEKLQGSRQVPAPGLVPGACRDRRFCAPKPAACREPICRTTARTEWDLRSPRLPRWRSTSRSRSSTASAAPMYGPTQPSGMFNFVTKRPTDEQYREVELDYEGDSVGTVHADLGGRVGPNHMFGYRTNLVLGDGTGYVTDSQLRRQLAAVALDVRLPPKRSSKATSATTNLFQHGYPGWFTYAPTTTPPSVAGSKSILLPADAPDPTRRGLRTVLFGRGYE